MMHKYIAILLFAGISTQINAQTLSKEEKKEVLEKLKEYKKDPASFKKMIANYKETIAANADEIDKQKASISELSKRYAEMQKQMMDAESELTTCQNKPVPKCPACATPGELPTTGTVYKVQIGLFKKFDMTSYFNQPKYMGVEKDGDKNRYNISYFLDKEEAEHLVYDLRKLGLHGAFVAKYENGERVMERPKTSKRPIK